MLLERNESKNNRYKLNDGRGGSKGGAGEWHHCDIPAPATGNQDRQGKGSPYWKKLGPQRTVKLP